MLRFQLIRRSNNVAVPYGTVVLSDDAHGADEYLRLRKLGFELHRIHSDVDEAE